MKYFQKRSIGMLIMIIAGQCCLMAAEPLIKFWEPIQNKTIRFDTNQQWYIEGASYKGQGLRVTDLMDLNFTADGDGYSVDYLYKVSKVTYRFNQQGRLLQMQSVLTDPGLIKVAAMDSQSVLVSKAGMQVRTVLAGTTKSEKTFAYPKGALYFDMVQYTLLLLLQHGAAQSFNADVIVNNSDSYNADFRLITTQQPLQLSDKYKYPQLFADLLKSGTKPDYLVYEMSMTGIVGLVYPHKWYWVFRNDPDKTYVALWGGDPASSQFMWRNK